MKSYKLKPGLVISLSIGCIFSLRLLLPLRKVHGYNRAGRLAEVGLFDIVQQIIVLSLFALSCWLIHQYLLQTRFKQNRLNEKWARGLLGVLLCMVLSHGFDMVQQFFSELIPEAQQGLVRKQFFLSVRGLVVGSFQFFMVYYIAAVAEAQQAKIEIEQLKKENLEARLNLLKQQISPHFLFNSLSTLKTIAPDHNTRQYIMQLSNVYRYLLNYNDNHMATLQNELAFTNSYLYILQERFEKALQVNIQVQQELLTKNIPPLSLQILIENSIKHNIISTDEPLQIDISSEQDTTLIVRNNLQPKLSIEKSNGKGLQNINDRYQLLSGKQIDIVQTREHFIVKLPLL